MGTSIERSTAVIAQMRPLVAMGLASLLLACSAQQEPQRLTPHALQAELDQHLGKGATPEQVLAYLARKGFEHSALIDNAGQAHLGADPDSFEIKAIARKARTTALVTTDIAMTFTFDRTKALTGITVKDVHTGL